MKKYKSLTFARQFSGWIVPLAFISCFILSNVYAQSNDGSSIDQRRKILGIYNHVDEYAFALNDIQRNMHSVLNYYGYMVELLDVNDQIYYDDEKMKDYAAIIIRFTSQSIPNADGFLTWIEKQSEKGIKIIIMGFTGMEIDHVTGQSLSPGLKVRLLSLVGLGYRLVNSNATSKVELVSQDSNMIGFEYQLKENPGSYEWNAALNEDVKSWLVIEHTDMEESDSIIVATSPTGGYIKNGYVYWAEETPPYRQKWIINPFLFFKEILKPELRPIPDPTTKNGKRVFYSHVDGDAAYNVSRVEADKFCSEVFEEVLKEYSNIKVGVSVVVAEIDPKERGNQRLVDSMRRIFAMDNVEIASHTYHHPFKWRDPGRSSGYMKAPFDLEKQIYGSIDYINNVLAPDNKKLKALYWTGDTNPPLEAFEMLNTLGIDSINGGDGAFDQQYPSYTSVSPLVRHMGGDHWQVHSSQSNENLYTNLWREDFNGFENVIQTFKRTDTPYRMSPVNIYYHFYSVERIAALKALKNTYNWALEQNMEMVFPSEYIAFVRGFLSMEIIKLDSNRFEIRNRGKLSTVRVDEGIVILKKSKGVSAVTEHNDSLYVSLDEETETPVVYIDY